MTRWTLLGILSVLLLGAPGGCGSHGSSAPADMAEPATSLGICHATCTWYKTCMPQMLTPGCDSMCNMMAGAYMDQDTMNDEQCTNAAANRRLTLACLGLSCTQVQPCLNAINTTCIPPP